VAIYTNSSRKEDYTNLSTNHLYIFAALLADINKALDKLNQKDKAVNAWELLPIQYHEFLLVFDLEKANELLLYYPGLDYKININREPPFGLLYNMSCNELLILQKTLIDLLDKGFIQVSASPTSILVLFVYKPRGRLCFCIDYWALNRLTIKDWYPLPLIWETLNNIVKAKWFTKLDIITAFYKL
jgi:hypothetical protein